MVNKCIYSEYQGSLEHFLLNDRKSAMQFRRSYKKRETLPNSLLCTWCIVVVANPHTFQAIPPYVSKLFGKPFQVISPNLSKLFGKPFPNSSRER
jgi:hypothetical protein